MSYRRPTITVFLCLLAVLPRPAPAAEGTAGQDRLVVCLPSPVVSLDPTDYRDRTTQMVLKNVFDSLTTRDRNMQVVPQLAESWRTLDDLTWEFRLKQGVRFHNGDPFSAEDVRFTMDRVIREGALDGSTSPRKGLFRLLDEVRIIDKYTVHMITEKPWPILPLMLTLQEIVPKAYMEKAGSRGFQARPVGTGPFQWGRRPDGMRLLLKRWEGYYGGSSYNPPQQVAPLKSLLFQTVPGPSDRISRLKTGRCDIIFNIAPSSVPLLDSVPDIHVQPTRPTRSYFAEINCRSPFFSDVRLRIAMNHAVDRSAIAASLLHGHGIILPTVLLPYAFAYHPDLQPYPYDPETAKDRIEASGYPAERAVSIRCTEDNLEFAGLIAGFLTRVGLKTDIRKTRRNKPDAGGNDSLWDIFVTSWGNSTLDPVGILVPKFKSGGRGNYSGYSDPVVDRLFERAEYMLDPKLREAYYRRIQEIVYRDAPMIFGYAVEEFYGVRNRVKNFLPQASGIINLHDVGARNGNSP